MNRFLEPQYIFLLAIEIRKEILIDINKVLFESFSVVLVAC